MARALIVVAIIIAAGKFFIQIQIFIIQIFKK
jgi:hypothetical protein